MKERGHWDMRADTRGDTRRRARDGARGRAVRRFADGLSHIEGAAHCDEAPPKKMNPRIIRFRLILNHMLSQMRRRL